jgi:RHS repeat-associated protein
VNGANMAYAYDELNRLHEAADLNTGTTSYTYDDVGNLRSYTYPNSVLNFHEYDSRNRLTNLSVKRFITPIANYAYTVGPAGHRLTADEELFGSSLNPYPSSIQRVYGYDRTYRLTNEALTVAGLSSSALAYTYDRVGNRLSLASTLAAIPSDNYGYDANDRLASDSYDANGNTLFAPNFGQGLPDKYDFENRLTERSEPQKHVRIIYDGDGHRVRKIVTTPTNTVTTYFLVDTVNLTGYAQVMEELTTDTSNPLLSTPQVTRVYSYGLDLIGQEQFVNGSWQLSFHGYDGHGNVRFLTSDTGAVTDTYDYDAFGNLIAATGTTPNAYLYCGEQLDSDLGLYFLRARYMNPETGRFWTMDSFEGWKEDPNSLHGYLYAHCNPISGRDPAGLWTTKQVLSAVLIATTVIAIPKISYDIYRSYYPKPTGFAWEIIADGGVGAEFYGKNIVEGAEDVLAFKKALEEIRRKQQTIIELKLYGHGSPGGTLGDSEKARISFASNYNSVDPAALTGKDLSDLLAGIVSSNALIELHFCFSADDSTVKDTFRAVSPSARIRGCQGVSRGAGDYGPILLGLKNLE